MGKASGIMGELREKGGTTKGWIKKEKRGGSSEEEVD